MVDQMDIGADWSIWTPYNGDAYAAWILNKPPLKQGDHCMAL